MSEDKRPNFLVFITDQHRADHLGCYGHPVLRTPHIDSIAEGGTRFTRFYVSNPVCMPNRATLMTGRPTSANGVRHNGIPLSLSASTFVEVLRLGGYDTALIGKSHLQNFTARPAEKGPNPAKGAALEEAWGPDGGDYGQETPARWQSPDPLKLSLPFYGFEHVDLVTLHGDQCGGHYYQWLREQVGDAEALRGPQNQLAHDYTAPQAWRTAVPEELYPTSYIRDRTVDWLGQRNDTEDPYFCFVSFPDPHHPFTPPGQYWDLYKPEQMTLPASFGAHQNPPPTLDWARREFESGDAAEDSTSAFMVSERHVLETMALTCGMTAMIDDAIGAILAALRALPSDRPTIIAFTTDHGDFLGDHGLMLKGPMHFDGLVRVPFIWNDPEADQVPVADGLSGTIDIARTVLARAGLAPYNGIQGQDLGATMTSGKSGRRSILIEDDGNRAYLGFSEPPRLRTVVTEQYRLSLYLGQDWGELYDLEADPDECLNLWDDPEHAAVRADLVTELAHRMIEADETSPWPKLVA
ncbi:MAG: sulfatase-like hydrolase/transferase [Rhodospirillaceae bacterium]|nr:sulfatase-like hydrolase/transferase [Rhodospirillaceae bacterium]